jgi:hypothetical protein
MSCVNYNVLSVKTYNFEIKRGFWLHYCENLHALGTATNAGNKKTTFAIFFAYFGAHMCKKEISQL